MSTSIEIRPLFALRDMYPAVELQRAYWGDDVESVIPAHMLFSLANHGGHVLAAFDGSRMVGVLVGFLGTDIEYDRPAMANLQMVSKRMVVLPEYRGHGLGYRLKLAQRELTMRQGVRLVTWTFDPLLALNAHLNIRKLGAICQKFRENYYGEDEAGGLAVLGASDRLFVEWWITHRRVKERLEGRRSGLGLAQYLDADVVIINPTIASTDGTPWPAERTRDVVGSMVLMEIPRDYPAISRTDESLARAWRLHTRQQIELLMRAGYIVTDFIRDAHEGRERAFYLFSQRGPQFDFSQN
ncbi:MAG TPA: GNAT family N-acetyltransferase [Spirillospora sp.]|nr:GNAT family N-acetyltransferase [Spirillospora sp.]